MSPSGGSVLILLAGTPQSPEGPGGGLRDIDPEFNLITGSQRLRSYESHKKKVTCFGVGQRAHTRTRRPATAHTLLISFSLLNPPQIIPVIPPAAVADADQLGGAGLDTQDVVEGVFRGRDEVQFTLLPHHLPSSFGRKKTNRIWI